MVLLRTAILKPASAEHLSRNGQDGFTVLAGDELGPAWLS